MISIGVVYKGMELRSSAIARSLQVASTVIESIRGPLEVGANPVVNPIFVVPGSMGAADFRGFKAGRFSKKNKLFAVLIEVPEGNVHSVESSAFVVQALQEVARLAEVKFCSKGESFNMPVALECIQRVSAALSVQAQQQVQGPTSPPSAGPRP